MTFLTSTVLYVNYISIKLEKTSLFKGCPMTGGMSQKEEDQDEKDKKPKKIYVVSMTVEM